MDFLIQYRVGADKVAEQEVGIREFVAAVKARSIQAIATRSIARKTESRSFTMHGSPTRRRSNDSGGSRTSSHSPTASPAARRRAPRSLGSTVSRLPRPKSGSAPGGRDKEFAVAFGPGYWAFGNADHTPTGPSVKPLVDAVADLLMGGGVAHHTATAHRRGSDLELGLDERHKMSGCRRQRQRRRQHRAKADEASVADDEVGPIGHLIAADVASVGSFPHHDARIVAKLPGELAVANIDGVDATRPPREQDIGEATGRCADIEGDRAKWFDLEVLKRVVELETATANPAMIAAPNLERRVGRETQAGFVEASSSREDDAGHDQGTGTGAALGQAAHHQELIEPRFLVALGSGRGRRRHRSGARALGRLVERGQCRRHDVGRVHRRRVVHPGRRVVIEEYVRQHHGADLEPTVQEIVAS